MLRAFSLYVASASASWTVADACWSPAAKKSLLPNFSVLFRSRNTTMAGRSQVFEHLGAYAKHPPIATL